MSDNSWVPKRGNLRERSPVRLMLWMVLLAFLAGPVADTLGEEVENIGVFSLLMIPVGWTVQAVGRQGQALVLGFRPRPWLGGRLRRWQKLILPFGTAGVLSTSLTCTMTGAAVLLTSPPGWTALNIIALGAVAGGGLLMGFGLFRLLVAVVVIHRSGLWGPSRRAWMIGGVVVATGSVAHLVYSVTTTLKIVPGI